MDSRIDAPYSNSAMFRESGIQIVGKNLADNIGSRYISDQCSTKSKSTGDYFSLVAKNHQWLNMPPVLIKPQVVKYVNSTEKLIWLKCF